jgi:hypothetical protein
MYIIKDKQIPLFLMTSGAGFVYWTFDKTEANQFETPESASRTIRKYGGIVEEL